MRDVLDPARRRGAGIWIQWSAIRYIETVFSARFEREREVVESLRLEIGAGHAGRLWVGGELLAILRWQLDHLVGICHRADEFSTITLKLVSAIEHWCRSTDRRSPVSSSSRSDED